MPTTTTARVRQATVCDPDETTAVRRIAQALTVDRPVLTAMFCSPTYDVDRLERAVTAHFADQLVIGCTSAGEIGDQGYVTDSITGVTLGAGDFDATVEVIESLPSFSVARARHVVDRLLTEFLRRGIEASARTCFALLLVDGLSMCEEPLTYMLQGALGDIPLVGGSAGDGLRFRRTCVLGGGRFRTGAAVLALVHTRRPFAAFQTQHFTASPTKVVVTKADVERRIVDELNGMPAAAEFARLAGVDGPEALSPAVFARHPLMLRMGGSWYVRSVQKANPDGSLTIYCAIDEGLVLTLGRGDNLVEHLRDRLGELRQRLGPPQVTLAFDCILRRLELESEQRLAEASTLAREHRMVGFSTYGEQFGAIHVNQTVTGVMLA